MHWHVFDRPPWLTLIAVVGTASAGSAQDRAASYGASARVLAPMAATNAEDPTAAGSTIRARGRARALEDVSEAMAEVPGVRVTSSGGAGSFAGVSLRGGEVDHTSVLLDAIPLTAPDSAAFDLSLLPLSALDRIEVYRGGAPAWYSEGAIGGVVRFVPARAQHDQLQATLGAGSFGRRELRLTGNVSRSGPLAPAVFSHARLLYADNDYDYLDDGQTRFDESDDRQLRQRNADHLAGDGLLHAGVDALGGRVTLLLAGNGRVQGVPGPLATPARRARASLVRTLAGLAYQREARDSDGERAHRVQLVASAGHQRNSLTDLLGELGRSRRIDTDDVWQRAYLRAAGGLRVLPGLEPTLVLSLAHDAFRPEDHAAFSNPPRPSGRTTETVTLEPRVYGRVLGMRAELRPSLRLALSQSAIRSDTGLREVEARRDDVNAVYRVAAAIEPAGGVSLASSFATGSRLPSIFELFGDRLYREPNPLLRPERSRAVDAGVVVRGRTGRLAGSAEARGFALFVDDLIQLERTSRFTMRPRNVAQARIVGLELGVTGRYGRHLALSGSLTALDTRNQFGRDLPLRPALQALVRPQVTIYPAALDRLSLFAEAHHVSFFYLDDPNLSGWPARTLLSAGVSLTLLKSHLTLEARVNDVLDVQPIDILSRPLPGRELRLSLTVR